MKLHLRHFPILSVLPLFFYITIYIILYYNNIITTKYDILYNYVNDAIEIVLILYVVKEINITNNFRWKKSLLFDICCSFAVKNMIFFYCFPNFFGFPHAKHFKLYVV